MNAFLDKIILFQTEILGKMLPNIIKVFEFQVARLRKHSLQVAPESVYPSNVHRGSYRFLRASYTAGSMAGLGFSMAILGKGSFIHYVSTFLDLFGTYPISPSPYVSIFYVMKIHKQKLPFSNPLLFYKFHGMAILLQSQLIFLSEIDKFCSIENEKCNRILQEFLFHLILSSRSYGHQIIQEFVMEQQIVADFSNFIQRLF